MALLNVETCDHTNHFANLWYKINIGKYLAIHNMNRQVHIDIMFKSGPIVQNRSAMRRIEAESGQTYLVMWVAQYIRVS